MTDRQKESLRFVVRHYRPDSFRVGLLFADLRHRRRRLAVAATVSGILVAAASAYLIFPQHDRASEPQNMEQLAVHTSPGTPAPAPEESKPLLIEVKKIEFTYASLAEVVQAIEETYGVKLTGYENAEDIHLTLSYEGTAADLVETINELTGTHLKISD